MVLQLYLRVTNTHLLFGRIVAYSKFICINELRLPSGDGTMIHATTVDHVLIRGLKRYASTST